MEMTDYEISDRFLDNPTDRIICIPARRLLAGARQCLSEITPVSEETGKLTWFHLQNDGVAFIPGRAHLNFSDNSIEITNGRHRSLWAATAGASFIPLIFCATDPFALLRANGYEPIESHVITLPGPTRKMVAEHLNTPNKDIDIEGVFKSMRRSNPEKDC